MKHLSFFWQYTIIATTILYFSLSTYANVELFAEITDFTAIYDESTNIVSVDWTVWNENNVKRYELSESNTDANAFDVVYTKASSGNKTESTQYHFEKQVFTPGIYYFKITTWYNDSSIELSKIISVNIETSVHTPQIKIYPNPADQIVNIDFGREVETHQIRIFNLIGKEVDLPRVVTDRDNTNIISLPIHHLDKGTYIIHTEIDGVIYTNRILHLK